MADAPMPSDVFEAFRRGYMATTEAFNERDFERAFGGLPPEFEWHPDQRIPEARMLRGPEEIKRFFEIGILEVFPDWRSEPQEFADLGDGVFLVHARVSGTSRAMGLGGHIEAFQVWETDNGVPIRMREFGDRESALEAAGVESAD